MNNMYSMLLPPTGRTPIPPPLRARFAVIEAQRAEEAAMGERPLEEVVAPVPLPDVSHWVTLMAFYSKHRTRQLGL